MFNIYGLLNNLVKNSLQIRSYAEDNASKNKERVMETVSTSTQVRWFPKVVWQPRSINGRALQPLTSDLPVVALTNHFSSLEKLEQEHM